MHIMHGVKTLRLNDAHDFAALVKQLRGTRSQTELAGMLRLNSSTVSRAEAGLIKPLADSASRLLAAFDVELVVRPRARRRSRSQ